MKKYTILLIAAFVLPALVGVSPTLADYTAHLGSLSWKNHGDYVHSWDDDLGQWVDWTGDDFNGSGAIPTPPDPPYVHITDPPLNKGGGITRFCHER